MPEIPQREADAIWQHLKQAHNLDDVQPGPVPEIHDDAHARGLADHEHPAEWTDDGPWPELADPPASRPGALDRARSILVKAEPLEESPTGIGHLSEANHRTLLLEAMVSTHAAVQLGDQDQRIIDWLAGWDNDVVVTVASLLRRAFLAGENNTRHAQPSTDD